MAAAAALAVDGSGTAAQWSPRAVRTNWHVMSFIFGLNHGCVTTPLIFATTVLDRRVGYAGSALLYVFTCVGSLFFAVPVVITVGHRLGLFLGMCLYSVYVGGFAVAAFLPMGSSLQWLAFLVASCLGGLAASMIWVAQGGYLDRSVTAQLAGGAGARQQAAAAEGAEDQRQAATAELSSIFAVYYLMFEVVCKLASSLALRWGVQAWIIFGVCLCLGAASSAAVLSVLDLGVANASASSARGDGRSRWCGKMWKAAGLWADPALWCLSLTNLTFGFAAAFMNGYVNAEYTKKQLGAEWVGFYATATSLTAAVLSHVFGAASKRLGAKGPFVFIGSCCFFVVPVLVLTMNLQGWGYGLIALYLFQGCGRAVYESTNRGVFADFFPGERSEGAFANLMMQATLSFALCFFFSAVLSREALAGIVLVLSASTFPMYATARWLRRVADEADSDDENDDASTEEVEEVGSARAKGA